ncbi:CHAT domain-containing protein, partial [Actinoplanes utahensis]
PAAAEAALQQAAALADGDAAAQAHLDLVRGDWLAEPAGHVETLGAPGLPAPGLHAPGLHASGLHASGLHASGSHALGAARELYSRAEQRWAAIGSRSGQAAIALRRAHLARLAGRATERDEHLEHARTLAGAAGHGSLAALITVHRAVDLIADGRRPPPEPVDQVGDWVRGDGSRSFGAGLVRLLLMRARAWRDDGDFTRAHRTVRLARRLGGPDGHRFDGASISVALAADYGGAGYRRARMRRAEAELDTAPRPRSALDWVTCAVRALELYAEANALADPDALDDAAIRLGQVLALPVRPDPDDMAAVGAARSEVALAWGRSTALRGWYEGLRLRDQGRPEAARLAFEQALEAAGDDAFPRCAVLTALGRRDEALAIAYDLSTLMPPEQAANLFLRLDEAEFAALALAGVDGPADPPWLLDALWARLHRTVGDTAGQIRRATAAVGIFEERRNRLARDLLRSAASDDLVVAGAYHDLLTGLVAAGDGAAALAVSDRARGLPFTLLADLSAEPGRVRRAVRAWLAEESRWAAAHEAARLDADRLDRAEEAVDEAEERVEERLVRRRIAPPPDVAAAVAALPGDAVLLAYHRYEQELVGWAATGDGEITCAGPVRDPDVLTHTARWHDALRGGETDPASAAALAGRLLEPFADRIAGRRRVLIVAHRDLALVPFHALPWAGGLLGDRHDVSYLPAVSLLTRRPGGPLRLGDALVVGDPAFDPRTGPPPLPGTRCEALAVAGLLGAGPPLLGAGATATAVLRRAPGAGVVHLASHAIVPPGAPNLAHVVLAGGSRLTVADLLGLDLTGALVVLSACRTGTGTATHGGDLIGLTRAVLLAGAEHAVVSLWPVHDAVAAVLMRDFYTHLRDGVRPGAALARAQRQVRALPETVLTAEYANLAAGLGAPADAAGVRDAGGDQETAPDPMHGWAPFVHVGRL